MLEEDHAESLNDEARRVLGVIRRNTQRMGQLIDDLLRFSRLGRQAMKWGEVKMRSVVQSVADDLRGAEPSRVIEFRIGDLPTVVCDQDLIRQVWINLLANAAKYSRGRSLATVEVDGVLDGAEVRYTVKDNGSGFEPKYSDKLFQVFQRLHKASEFEGTGVGLALVQRIVSRHGGRVWAEGRPDEGATFGFALPRRSHHE